ncbi:MAG: DMT family transporter [Clostridia bacterium]|nr:DMT family transporter [Clostridia bacterium]
MHISQTAKGRLLIISTALLWGLAGVCVKSIPWSAFSIMSARCMICILILSVSRRGRRLKITKRNVAGAVMESLTGILYMSSIKLTTAATAIVLQYTAPVFVFLYAVFVQKNKPRLRDILILCTVFGGCVLSFADGLAPQNLLGNLLGLASGMTFAGQIIFFGEKNEDADSGILLGNIISAVVCFPAFFFDRHLDFSTKTIFWVLVLGVFQYGLANLCFAHGCTKLKKTETSLLLTIEPIFNPIPVWLVTGEIPGPLAIAGFFVVIAGITAYTLTRSASAAREQ